MCVIVTKLKLYSPGSLYQWEEYDEDMRNEHCPENIEHEKENTIFFENFSGSNVLHCSRMA